MLFRSFPLLRYSTFPLLGHPVTMALRYFSFQLFVTPCSHGTLSLFRFVLQLGFPLLHVLMFPLRIPICWFPLTASARSSVLPVNPCPFVFIALLRYSSLFLGIVTPLVRTFRASRYFPVFPFPLTVRLSGCWLSCPPVVGFFPSGCQLSSRLSG